MNLGVPVVLALNMMDLVEKNGDKIDVDGLSKQLAARLFLLRRFVAAAWKMW